MSTIILRPQTRAEWLRERMNGIGSSEVATILGLNPFETPYQLWRRKLGMDAPQDETFAMKAGHYLEDAVSRFWSDETGREVIKNSAGDFIIRSAEKPYYQVSPDRTYWLAGEKRNAKNKGILECKTTQLAIDGDDLPKHWFCQVQYQLGVAELEQGSIAWLTQGREFGYRDMKFVPDFYAYLCEAIDKFWTDNIMGKQAPEMTNVQDILIKYNQAVANKVMEVPVETYNEYNRLKDLKGQIAELETEKESIESDLKMLMCDAEALAYEGSTLVTWKNAKASRRFDSKRFCSENPEIADKYMVTVDGSRRFLVK